MKHIISFCCLCAVAIAFVSGSLSAINASEPWQGRIDELVKPLVDQKKIVGAVVGMLTPMAAVSSIASERPRRMDLHRRPRLCLKSAR